MTERKSLKTVEKEKEKIKGMAEPADMTDSESDLEFDSKKDLSDEEIEELSKKITEEEIKKEVEEVKKRKENVDGKKDTLVPLEDYIKCAVHLGTKVITPHMKKFVYKRRADGLAVINTTSIDEKLRETIDFLIKYEPKEMVLVCKRETGWTGAEKFSEVTGVRAFTKKYPAGILTNLKLDDFFENEVTVICDPWLDKNALNDTAKLKKPVVSLCDTNNFTTNVTQIIPCNNKAKKSIGCILYILAREYTKAKKMPFNAVLEDFTGKLDEIETQEQ
jgi:ribosomal protein uS2